jgi:hypothetical protein
MHKRYMNAKKKTPKPKGFYTDGKRGSRGVDRVQFHILLTKEERAKLVTLSHKKKMNAADVVRDLIAKAR